MSLELFPDDIIEEYKLRDMINEKGCVYCEVTRGMYGLPQAGLLAQEQLTKRLKKAGYTQCEVDWSPLVLPETGCYFALRVSSLLQPFGQLFLR